MAAGCEYKYAALEPVVISAPCMPPGFAITFRGGPFVSDLAENRSETVSDLSENRSETKVGDTRPGQEPKEKS